MEAIPFSAYETLPVEELSGKIVISASNYYPARDGLMDIAETYTDTIAEHLKDSRVVKAFNETYWETLRDGQRPDTDPGDRLALFLASDDEEAKAVVAGLIEDIGFTPVDAGPLTERGSPHRTGFAHLYRTDDGERGTGTVNSTPNDRSCI